MAFTATTPVPAFTAELVPVVVALEPEGAVPPGVMDMRNWSAAASRFPLSALVNCKVNRHLMLSGVDTVSVVVTPTTSVVPVTVGRSFTVAVLVMVAGHGAVALMSCSYMMVSVSPTFSPRLPPLGVPGANGAE